MQQSRLHFHHRSVTQTPDQHGQDSRHPQRPPRQRPPPVARRRLRHRRRLRRHRCRTRGPPRVIWVVAALTTAFRRTRPESDVCTAHAGSRSATDASPEPPVRPPPEDTSRHQPATGEVCDGPGQAPSNYQLSAANAYEIRCRLVSSRGHVTELAKRSVADRSLTVEASFVLA